MCSFHLYMFSTSICCFKCSRLFTATRSFLLSIPLIPVPFFHELIALNFLCSIAHSPRSANAILHCPWKAVSGFHRLYLIYLLFALLILFLFFFLSKRKGFHFPGFLLLFSYSLFLVLREWVTFKHWIRLRRASEGKLLKSI